MSDHLPEDIVRAQDVDTLLDALCDDPCKDASQTVRDGCSCAMIRAIVEGLQTDLKNWKKTAGLLSASRDRWRGAAKAAPPRDGAGAEE